MRTALLLSAASLALASCNSRSDEPAGTATSDAAVVNDPAAMPTGAANPAASAEQQFVDTVAASDAFEIQSSQLAQSKASSKAVKDFAAMMVDQHAKSSADLKKAALGASPSVPVSAQLTATQQVDLDALRGATGAEFDKLYVQKQIAAHEAAKALLSDYSATATPGPLRDFASKTVTVVSGHLDQAKKLPQ